MSTRQSEKLSRPPAAEAVLCWIPGQARNDIGCGLVCCALVVIRWSLVNRVGNELPTLQGWENGHG